MAMTGLDIARTCIQVRLINKCRDRTNKPRPSPAAKLPMCLAQHDGQLLGCVCINICILSMNTAKHGFYEDICDRHVQSGDGRISSGLAAMRS
jgi:hypothetical protein